MKRKLSEPDVKIVFGFELLDTPGDEITPGSDEIREYFENELVRHKTSYSNDGRPIIF